MDATANIAKQLRSALCRSFVNLCWPPAPKARWPVPIPTQVMIELLLFGAAVGALAVARQPVLALILGVAALTPSLLNASRSARRATDRQIRSLVLYVHAVPLSAVGAAQVRGRIQRDRRSAVW